MFDFLKKIVSNKEISMGNLLVIIGIARKIGISPRELIDYSIDPKNIEYLKTTNEYMLQELKKKTGV